MKKCIKGIMLVITPNEKFIVGCGGKIQKAYGKIKEGNKKTITKEFNKTGLKCRTDKIDHYNTQTYICAWMFKDVETLRDDIENEYSLVSTDCLDYFEDDKELIKNYLEDNEEKINMIQTNLKIKWLGLSPIREDSIKKYMEGGKNK